MHRPYPAEGLRKKYLPRVLGPRPNNCTTVYFIRQDESDFGIGSGGSLHHFVVREELMRRKPRIENYEDLKPQGLNPSP
jgi:hypothetical protein